MFGLGKLASLWSGNGSNGISTRSGGSDVMSASINGNMPQLDGVGAMLSPGDTNYKGHFRDGDFILKAEENNLENYQMLQGLTEAEMNNANTDLRSAINVYRNIRKASDKRTKIVQLHNQTKAIVTGNHLRQFQSASALKSSQMRSASGYLIEKDRLKIAADQTNKKVNEFRQRLAERAGNQR